MFQLLVCQTSIHFYFLAVLVVFFFKFVVVLLLLVVRGGKVYLPTPPSWPKILFFLFLERGERRERERNSNVWLPLMCPLLGTWPTPQACALTGFRTRDPLVYRPALNPLRHTSQGLTLVYINYPMVKLISSYVISLKVAEPIDNL